MKLSLFSVGYAGYWGQHQLDLLQFIARAAEFGYDAVMIAGKRPHLSPLDATDEHLATVKEALQQHNIECAVIAGYTDLSPSGAAEVPIAELQIAYVQALSRIASTLGASIVRVFSSYEADQSSPQQTWGGMVTALREMCDRAAEYKVTIAVQNHHDLGVHSDVLLELISDVDRSNCKVGFDAWAPALCGENLFESARKMAPHAVMTTNADYIRLPRFRYQPELVSYQPIWPDWVRAVKFGDGFIDLGSFFAGLREGGFDGIANYEMCSPVRGGGSIQNLDAYCQHYLSWMRENW